MPVLSLVWGILALLGMFIGFLPCVGWLNWLNIPFAVCGLIISIVAYARPGSEGKGAALAGLVCCAAAVIIGGIRLVMGGGVI
jgi:hypothetical protein